MQQRTENRKKPLYIAFTTQKGGAGKTTLTVLTAGYLHYLTDYTVGIIDCDFPQYSIQEMRERDIKQIETNSYYGNLAEKQFSKLNKSVYPVEISTVADALRSAEKMTADYEMDFDIIFFDLPGTLNTPGFIETVSGMDYIFSPISADRMVLESTLSFAQAFNDMYIKPGSVAVKGLYLLWNMVDLRESTELYDEYTALIESIGLTILDTRLPDSKRFRKEMSVNNKAIFRSTLFPIDKTLIKSSRIEEMIKEMAEIMSPETGTGNIKSIETTEN